MDIEKKYNQALKLLYSIYLAEDTEEIRVSDKILEQYNLGIDFWDVICPRLKKEGILESYAKIFPEYNNQLAEELQTKLFKYRNLGAESRAKEGIFSPGFVHDKASIHVLQKYGDIDKTISLLEEKLKEFPRYYSFTINGKNLESAVFQADGNKKIIINVDNIKGIWRRIGNDELKYGITSGRAAIVKKLCESNFVRSKTLQETSKLNEQGVSKAKKEINKVFRKHLKLNHDLIQQDMASGYHLNKEKYDFLISLD